METGLFLFGILTTRYFRALLFSAWNCLKMNFVTELGKHVEIMLGEAQTIFLRPVWVMKPKQWFRKDRFGLIFLTSITILAYGALVSMDFVYGTLRDSYTPQSIGWYLLAFVAYIAILVWVERWGIGRKWMWGGAVLLRVMMLLTTPTLSDDVYRMLWDGYVAHQGVSPYMHAIDSPALDHLEVPVRGLANNAWMASPYLPAAQGVFYGVTAVFPLKPIFLQGIMVIFDLLSAWLIARLLALALLPGRRLMIYLWNPLVIIEVAHGAHIDAWMILLALLAVYLALRQSGGRDIIPWFRQSKSISYLAHFLSPLFLALGTLTKLLPVLLLPVLFWLWNWPQRVFYALVTLLLLLPFGMSAGWGLSGDLDGTGLFGAIRIYADQWNFNSGIFHWLEVWLDKLGVDKPLGMAKGIVVLLLLVVVTAVWIAARKRTATRTALRIMSVPLIGYVLLTPTFHPWYLLLLLAFVPFLAPAEDESPWRWLLAAPWLYLSGALVFSYMTYLDPLNYGELEWVRQVEWIPTILLLVAGLVAERIRRLERGKHVGKHV